MNTTNMSMIATVRGGTLEQYDKAAAELIKANPPTGLLHHVCVPTDDGFMIIETWESEKAIEDFTSSERFRRETGATGMPQPDIQIRPVHNMRVLS
jgi:quinol monooxygenase YgiN